jgi:hypothetical protein
MKLAIILLSLCMASSAFTVATLRAAPTPTALNAATMDNTPDEPGWGMNRPESTKKKSTKPVADRMNSKIDRMMMKDVVLDPDFTLTWAFDLVAPLIAWLHPCKFLDPLELQ